MDNIPMSKWGRDHWSTLAYIEIRVVDHHGIPELRHMRCHPDLHPAQCHTEWRGDYPTRLREGEVTPHDDYSCLEDAEAEGLLENKGTGINPVYVLTDYGMIVCNALRNHKASGGSFANFTFTPLETVSDTTL